MSSAINPHSYDNGVMARKYGLPREVFKTSANRGAWERGWDAEDKRRKARASILLQERER